MKFCIFVCIFVVLACHEAFCESAIDFPAALKGNCKLELLSDADLNACQEITCHQDEKGFSRSILTCSLGHCPNGKQLGVGPHDLTKKFPGCCRPNTCD